MSSAINTKRGNIALDYLKRSAGIIRGATGEYIKEAMPVSTSTIEGTRETLGEFQQKFKATSSAVMPKIRQLSVQSGFRNLNNWFLQKSDEFSGFDPDGNLDFDIDTSDAASTIATQQITEGTKNANMISKAVVESSHKMVESQLSATANLLTSVDRLSSTVASGFDNTNKTLNKILEVLTKNTSAIIEATVSGQQKDSPNDKLAGSGRFNMSEYKKMVKQNLAGSEMGLMASMMQMAMTPGMITPEFIFGELFKSGLDKAAPNLKKNMAALDGAVNEMIMGSLIRLGEKGREGAGPLASLMKAFGIDADRVHGGKVERSALELKAVPFDTVTKTAITETIPGYLRKILKQLGGKDEEYDYRSRSFRAKGSMQQDYRDTRLAGTRGALHRASAGVRGALNTGRVDDAALYELMMMDMAGRGTAGARQKADMFGDAKNLDAIKTYLKDDVLRGIDSSVFGKALDDFAQNLTKIQHGFGHHEIVNQSGRINIQANKASAAHRKQAEQMSTMGALVGMDEGIESVRNDLIKALKLSGPESSKAGAKTQGALSGVDYTNRALFEIHRRLNRGINVFIRGQSNTLQKKFKGLYLPAPVGYRPKAEQEDQEKPVYGQGAGTPTAGGTPYDRGVNRLTQTHEEYEVDVIGPDGKPTGEKEIRTRELSKGDRLKNFATQRGGGLAKAMFSGNQEDVRQAFSDIISDVRDVAGPMARAKMEQINESFGNVTGYLKHKFLGHAYEYKDSEGNPVKVKENDKGGIIGYLKDSVGDMFKGTGEKGKKWFNDVKGYFKFGDGDEKGDVKEKRKSIIAASIGAMAGFGFLGGPIGLVLGAVAGNALTASGFGEKMKKLFFGKEKRDAEGKKIEKDGLFTKAVNSVLDPIRYQMSKTFHHIGDVLKKNILGPLSDIGQAIKHRVSKGMNSMFGKIFGFVGKALLAPIKGLMGAVKAPTGLIGGGVRGATSVAGGVVGGGLTGLARLIGGRGFGSVLKERQRGRADEIDEDRRRSGIFDYTGGYEDTYDVDGVDQRIRGEDGEFLRNEQDQYVDSEGKVIEATGRRGVGRRKLTGGFKQWQARQKEMRAGRNIEDYTREVHETTADNTSEIADATKETAETLGDLTSSIQGEIGPHSFWVADKNSHELLADIRDILSSAFGGAAGGDLAARRALRERGQDPPPPDQDPTTEAGAGSVVMGSNSSSNSGAAAIQAAATMGTADGAFSNDEARIKKQIMEEGMKEEPDESKLKAGLTDLVSQNKQDQEEEKDDTRGFFGKMFDKVTGGLGLIGSTLGSVGGSILGALGPLKPLGLAVGGLVTISEINSLWENVIKGDMDLRDWWENESKIGKAVDVIRGVLDFKSNILLGPVLNMTNGIASIASRFGFSLPTIERPQEGESKLGATLATGVLASLYVKIAQLGVQAYKAGKATIGSIANLAGGRGGWGGRALGAASVAMLGHSLITGPEVHANTDAAGNEIRDYGQTNARRAPGARYLAHGANQALSTAVNNVDGGIVGRQAASLTQRAGAAGLNVSESAVQRTAQQQVGHLGRAAGAAADVAEEAVEPGKVKRFMNNAVTGMKNFLKRKFPTATETIARNFDSILRAIANGADSLVRRLPGKIARILTRGAAQEAAGAATAGIGYAVMAFGGALSGGLSAANIFGVRENDVTAGMRTIASTIVAMLNGVPGLWALELIDLILVPVMGTTVRQLVCRMLYSLVGDADRLAEAQATFQGDMSWYNEQFGVDLSIEEYNDMVNRGMWSQMAGGRVRTNEEGRAMFDLAGGTVRGGGLAGAFVSAGGMRQYQTDADGSVIRHDADGNRVFRDYEYGGFYTIDEVTGERRDHDGPGEAQRLTDSRGRNIRSTHIGRDGQIRRDRHGHVREQRGALSVVGDFFTGRTVYERDEYGQVMRDPVTGEPLVAREEKGLVTHIGKFFGGVGRGIASFFGGAGNVAGNLLFGRPQQALDEHGEPMYCEETGEPIMQRQGGLVGAVGSFFGGVAGGISRGFTGARNFLLGTGNVYKKGEDGEYILGPDGKPIVIEYGQEGLVGRVGRFFGGVASNVGGAIAGFARDPLKYIFGGRRLKRDEYGEPVIDPETGEPIVIDHQGLVGKIGSFIGGTVSRIGDFFGGVRSRVTGFFLGREEQAIGEDGIPLYDEEGNPIMQRGPNLLQRMGTAAGNVVGRIGNFIGGIGSRVSGFIRGKYEQALDEDGYPLYDEDGNPIMERGPSLLQRIGTSAGNVVGRIGNFIGGIRSRVSGFIRGHYEQALDENGYPLYDEDGNPIMERGPNLLQRIATSAGNVASRIGSFVGGIGSRVKGFIMGREQQALDEHGYPMYDEDNNPIMERGPSLLQRISTAAGNVAGRIGSFVGGVASNVKGFLMGRMEQALDEYGYPLYDEDGEPIMVQGPNLLQRMATSAGNVVSRVSDFVGGVGSHVKGFLLGRYEQALDEDGYPLYDEDGEPIMIKEDGFFRRMGIGIGNFLGRASDIIGGVGSHVRNFFLGHEEQAVGEDGELLYDEDGNPIMVETRGIFGRIGSAIGSAIGGVGRTIREWADDGWERDENGDILYVDGQRVPKGGLGNAFRRTAGRVTGFFRNLFNSAGDGVDGMDTDVGTGGGSGDGPSSRVNRHIGAGPSPFLDGSYRVTSPYGMRNFEGEKRFHSGVDMIPEKGKSGRLGPVVPGVVTRVEKDVTGFQRNSYGNYVEYMGADGTRYMNSHLAPGSIPGNLAPGSTIKPGMAIGKMGNTGHSYGEHLHFQMTNPGAGYDPRGKRSLNPLRSLGRGVSSAARRIAQRVGSGPSGGGRVELLTMQEAGQVLSSNGPWDITDLLTGISYRCFFRAGVDSRHTDVTPATEADTASMKQAAGGQWRWTGRPVVIRGNGRYIAAGMTTFPHGSWVSGGGASSGLPNNSNSTGSSQRHKPHPGSPGSSWGLGGHMCMYFKNSHGGAGNDRNPLVSDASWNAAGTTRGRQARSAAFEAFALGNNIPASQLDSMFANMGTAGTFTGGVSGGGIGMIDGANVEGQGPLAAFIAKIKAIGGKLLNKLTGGLFGASSDGASMDGSSGIDLSNFQHTDFSHLMGAENVETAWNFFRSKGMSPASTAAVLGTLLKETTNVNPAAFNANDNPRATGHPHSIGIAQWNGERALALRGLIGVPSINSPLPSSSLPTQLDFMWNDMNTDDINQRMKGQHATNRWMRENVGSDNNRKRGAQCLPGGFAEFKSGTDVQNLARLFDATYTRSGDYRHGNRLDQRVSKAISAYERFGRDVGPVRPEDLSTHDVFSLGMGPITAERAAEIINEQNGTQSSFGPSSSWNNPLTNSWAIQNNPAWRVGTDPLIDDLQEERSMIREGKLAPEDYLPKSPLIKYMSDTAIRSNQGINPFMGGMGDGPAFNDVDFNYVSAGGGGYAKLQKLEALFTAALIELKKINVNTGAGADSLAVISEMDLGVDQVLRDELKSLSKITRHKQIPYTAGNAKTVNSIIKAV